MLLHAEDKVVLVVSQNAFQMFFKYKTQYISGCLAVIVACLLDKCYVSRHELRKDSLQGQILPLTEQQH